MFIFSLRCLIIWCILGNMSYAVELDFSFVKSFGNEIAEDIFEQDNSLVNTESRLMVTINRRQYGVKIVSVVTSNERDCISYNIFKPIRLSDHFITEHLNSEKNCLEIKPENGVDYHYDSATQSISISIPQIYVKQDESDELNYDFGQNGLNLRYYANARCYNNEVDYYSSVDATINIAEWRIDFDGYASENQTEISNLVAKKDILALKSTLEVGNTYLSSDFINSFQFRGIVLESEMGLSSKRKENYTPIIRGIAQSNARIEIRQDERIILSEIVSPGPYEFRDYGVVTNGELTVTVTEESGLQDVSYYPVSTISSLKSIGYHDYSFALGSNSALEEGDFIYADYIYGLERATVSTSGLLAGNYQNFGAGAATNLGEYGGLAFRMNVSISDGVGENADRKIGTRYDLEYSKRIDDDTDLSLANIGYQDRDYLSFAESRNEPTKSNKNDLSLTVSRRLPFNISASLSAYQRTYWNDDPTSGFNLSMSGVIRKVSVSFVSSYTKIENDDQYSFTLGVSIPLGEAGSPYIYTSLQTDGEQENYSATVSDIIDARSSYHVSTNRSSTGSHSSNLGVSYRFDAVNTSTSVSRDSNDNVGWTTTASGSVLKVGDSDVVFDANHYQSALIVETDGLEGVRFSYGSNASDGGGSLVTTMSPYVHNERNIDTSTLPVGATINSYQYSMVPTQGALFYRFNPVYISVPVALVFESNTSVPVGSEIKQGMNTVGVMGVNNLAIVHLNPQIEGNHLTVVLGDESHCEIQNLKYNVDLETIDSVQVKNVECI